MRQTIRRLRNKSENTRRVIVFGASLGITVLIAVLWVSTLKTSSIIGRSTVSDQFKPLTLLKDSLVSGWDSLNIGKSGSASAVTGNTNNSTNTTEGNGFKVYTNDSGQTEVLLGTTN